ncbi:Glutamate racemase [Candidatus Ornithobacterium hominis]|uniref:glutamate racemase n=1 Tax=Candidatus Ornithobacterium hominis TaxID=2497989 RepID=UPI000E5A2CBC|nr:glutamate racemase [Candidatus Ornithobacterium hominis]SZD71725.1 Glutamate racemase [Candidatus Ornithobacterium hominis]
MIDSRPIGIFDSGVGGLSIAKEIKNFCPQENIIYFGDTKHLPYGQKSAQAIKEYSQKATRFLLEQDCKIIVVACNSASANALKEIKNLARERKIKVIDVITPVAEKVAFGFDQQVGVIATQATINAKMYTRKIRGFNKHIQVYELATPLLVPIVEEGLSKKEIAHQAIHHYLSHKKLQNIDSLILGCTHFSLIQKEINAFYEGKVRIINSPLIVANELKRFLVDHQMESENGLQDAFFVSDLTLNFIKFSKKNFSENIQLEEKKL